MRNLKCGTLTFYFASFHPQFLLNQIKDKKNKRNEQSNLRSVLLKKKNGANNSGAIVGRYAGTTNVSVRQKRLKNLFAKMQRIGVVKRSRDSCKYCTQIKRVMRTQRSKILSHQIYVIPTHVCICMQDATICGRYNSHVSVLS